MKRTLPSVLMFTHVHVENWKNFGVADLDLQRRVFLVGPNASGKSNLLDVFRFLQDVVSIGGGFQEAVQRRGGVSSLRSLAARKYSDVMIRVRVGTLENPRLWEYELRFGQDNVRRPTIKSEIVKREDGVLLQRPDEADLRDRERLTQTYLEQVHANQSFREVAEFLQKVRYLHIVPQLVRDPDRSIGRRGDPFGGDFLEQVASTTPRTRDARLRRILDTLRIAVPQLEDLELKRDDRGTPHLRGKYQHWRPHGAWQSEVQFSDGTLRLLGLLWALLDGNGPLLLEEPELSLHSEVVSRLPEMFARIQRHSGRQILVSTHSPEFLRSEGIGLDEVILLMPGKEGTSARPAKDVEEIPMLLSGGLELPEILMPRTRPEDVHQLTLFDENGREK